MRGVAARYPRGALATPHYLASAAGAAELARGGNAIDAIVAANLALGVVAPYYCGSGGDLFAIVWDGDLHGYLGSGRSPASATLDGVAERLGSEPLLVGPHSVTVPGAIAGWFDLLERWGTRSFGELAADGIRYARDGFVAEPDGRGGVPAIPSAVPRARRVAGALWRPTRRRPARAARRGQAPRAARQGRPGRVLPRCGRGVHRLGAAAARRLHGGVGPRRARRGVDRPCDRGLSRRHRGRAPTPDAGSRGARDPAHPRRVRSRHARRSRPRAPDDRGGEDRADRS